VEETRALRATLVEWIRRWRPDTLFTHDPEHPLPPYLSHRDHRLVGRAVLDAVYPMARDRLMFPEHARAGLQPHAVTAV
ncbi:MAG: PIG-L family deacetylase, partial [Chloroflexota bacterium]|nr:PIG-L family deacetylase [Chloroflexota bacterium]